MHCVSDLLGVESAEDLDTYPRRTEATVVPISRVALRVGLGGNRTVFVERSWILGASIKTWNA